MPISYWDKETTTETTTLIQSQTKETVGFPVQLALCGWSPQAFLCVIPSLGQPELLTAQNTKEASHMTQESREGAEEDRP